VLALWKVLTADAGTTDSLFGKAVCDMKRQVFRKALLAVLALVFALGNLNATPVASAETRGLVFDNVNLNSVWQQAGCVYEVDEYDVDDSGCITHYNKNEAVVKIPSSINDIAVTSLDTFAFSSKGVVSVEVSDGVTAIGYFCFGNCTKLESIILPETLQTLGNAAFKKCSALKSITIPGSVNCVDSNTFWGCSALKEVTILNGVQSIGSWAFVNCTALEDVTIPASVTEIENDAFDGCSKALILLHVTPGSAAEAFAVKYGYLYDNGLDTLRTVASPVSAKQSSAQCESFAQYLRFLIWHWFR